MTRFILLTHVALVSSALSQVPLKEMTSLERKLRDNQAKLQSKLTLNAPEYWAGETLASSCLLQIRRRRVWKCPTRFSPGTTDSI